MSVVRSGGWGGMWWDLGSGGIWWDLVESGECGMHENSWGLNDLARKNFGD